MDGETPLFNAAKGMKDKDDNGMINLLIQNGADINIKYNSGLTAENFEYNNSAIVPNNDKSVSKLGMTSNDVLNSTWDKPLKVNRTITANETSEQWVYSGNKYICLDNGKVTAIQD